MAGLMDLFSKPEFGMWLSNAGGALSNSSRGRGLGMGGAMHS